MSENKNIQVHVCHKCGLPRMVKPNRGWDKVGLDSCMCIGQTWFDYEETPRTIKEAREIAHKEYLEIVKLYKEQGREKNMFEELKGRYKEWTQWRRNYLTQESGNQRTTKSSKTSLNH